MKRSRQSLGTGTHHVVNKTITEQFPRSSYFQQILHNWFLISAVYSMNIWHCSYMTWHEMKWYLARHGLYIRHNTTIHKIVIFIVQQMTAITCKYRIEEKTIKECKFSSHNLSKIPTQSTWQQSYRNHIFWGPLFLFMECSRLLKQQSTSRMIQHTQNKRPRY